LLHTHGQDSSLQEHDKCRDGRISGRTRARFAIQYTGHQLPISCNSAYQLDLAGVVFRGTRLWKSGVSRNTFVVERERETIAGLMSIGWPKKVSPSLLSTPPPKRPNIVSD